MGWVISKDEINKNSHIIEKQTPKIEINKNILKIPDENTLSDILSNSEFVEIAKNIQNTSNNEFNILTIEHDDFEQPSSLNIEESLERFPLQKEEERYTKTDNIYSKNKCDIRVASRVKLENKLSDKINENHRKSQLKISFDSVRKCKKSVKNENILKSTKISPLKINVNNEIKQFTSVKNEKILKSTQISPLKIKENNEIKQFTFLQNEKISKSTLFSPSKLSENNEIKWDLSKSFPKLPSKMFPKNNSKPKILPPIPENQLCKKNKKEENLVNKLKIKMNNKNEGKNINIKEDIILIRGTECLSPLKVGDLEKTIFPRKSEIDFGEKDSLKKIGKKSKKRPQSALISQERDSIEKNNGFNNIILDFNKRLESIMKENVFLNSYCAKCCASSENETKTTANKITFFFIKKYGNFGKFILARLNEFFDNVTKETNNSSQKGALYNDFPLPCNINDIEFSGDLKPNNYHNSKESKIRNQPSKLPVLQARMKIEKFDNAEKESKRSTQNNNNIAEYRNKLRFPLRKNTPKICSSQKNKTLRKTLPKIKSAVSVTNFSKALPIKKKKEIPFCNINIDNSESCENYCYEDIIDVVNLSAYYPFENGFIDNVNNFEETNISEKPEVSNRDSLIYFNEEEVTTIDNLWRSTFIHDNTFNPITTD